MRCMQLYGGIAKSRSGIKALLNVYHALPLKLNKTTLNLLKQSAGPSCLATPLQLHVSQVIK